MHRITFECETITPMFMAGADGTTPELRAPSIKGALRFWWRALNGHLELEELKKREGEIFGTADEKVGRSKIIVLCKTKVFKRDTSSYRLVAHKGQASTSMTQSIEFTVILKLVKSIEFVGKNYTFDKEKLKALFEIVSFLGGFGKRSRRANGQFFIKSCDGLTTPSYSFSSSFVNKLNLLAVGIDPFSLSKNIISSHRGRLDFPHILSIEKLGSSKNHNAETLRTAISQATHDAKTQDSIKYRKYVGNGSPRLASPIVFGINSDGNSLYIVVTKLNLAGISKSRSAATQKMLIDKVKEKI